MEITGRIIAVLEPRGGVSKSGNNWKVQEYVLETNEQYPRKMCFDVFGEDKIQQFNIQAGDGREDGLTVSELGKWKDLLRIWVCSLSRLIILSLRYHRLLCLLLTSRLLTIRTICLSDNKGFIKREQPYRISI